MDDVESNDHFERMALHHRIERSRELIASYLEGMAQYHKKIKDARYDLGRLDERLEQ